MLHRPDADARALVFTLLFLNFYIMDVKQCCVHKNLDYEVSARYSTPQVVPQHSFAHTKYVPSFHFQAVSCSSGSSSVTVAAGMARLPGTDAGALHSRHIVHLARHLACMRICRCQTHAPVGVPFAPEFRSSPNVMDESTCLKHVGVRRVRKLQLCTPAPCSLGGRNGPRAANLSCRHSRTQP